MKTVFAVSVSLLQRHLALFAVMTFCGCVSTAFAQTAGGVVTGQILNTDTGEYVRNATVRVEGSNVSAISEDGGYYRLANVPAGEARIVVTYTGYPTAAAMVHVVADTEATHNFELSNAAPTANGTTADPIKLERFVVASQRVGESKALMEQRNSQDITNVVSSETFGDIGGGNIGEFLKNVPGVELDIDRGASTTIRLRGLPSQYTAVTVDGVSMANADANGAVAPNTRALNFSSFSLEGLDSIEVSKTVSADVDANAPAGTINLRPKRAFDLVGRRVVIETHITAPSGHFEFDRSNGPTDGGSRKALPGASIQYSDVLLNKRLGFNLTLGADEQFSDHMEVRHTYNYTPTATDTRPVVPTTIAFSHTPRNDSHKNVSFTVDYKAAPNLVLSLSLLYNTTELVTWQRDLNFNLGARNTVIGADPLVSFTTNSTAAAVVSSPTAIHKLNQSVSAIPKFEYRKGGLRLEGRFMLSDAKSWYDPNGREGAVRDLLGGTSPTDSGVTFTGVRSSAHDGDWQINQVAGPDWANGTNFTTGVPRMNDRRWAKTFSYSGDVTASLSTSVKGIPIVWKTGLKRFSQHRKYGNETALTAYTLNGAPARGGWADYRSPFEYEFGGDRLDASVSSVSAGRVWVPNLQGIGALLRDHPEQLTNTITASNYYTAMISERRDVEETVDAAFLMATATIGKAILRAGLRWEDTATDVLERDPRTGAELTAAGFAVEGPTAATPGRASTIAGLDYQYFSKPSIHRTGNYDNFFPSASLKYKLPKNIDLQLGFSSTIRRPTFGDLTGVWIINEPLRQVTAPNRNLHPEKSNNYALRLAKYFEPRGLLAVNFFQNQIKGLFQSNQVTAQEFGPVESAYDFTGYTFITTTQSANTTTVRGMEIEYSQGLSFLPKPLDGLSIRGSYTRTYADIPMTLIVPHSFTSGLNYAWRKVSAYANWTWRDTNLQAIGTITRAYRHEGKMDIGGTYKFNQRWSAYFYARNVLNTPRVVIEQSNGNPWITYGYFTDGSNWTFGGRYSF
jgi:iron complex outermembrane receptor protein